MRDLPADGFDVDPDYLANYGAALRTPELSLWRMVIVQACKDAHGEVELH